MELLTNPVRNYAWGSTSAIAGVQGRPVPSPEPEAELWMGGHPSAPSRVFRGPLDEVVAADPAGELGSEVADALGARLPFLMKLLAAETPLSLQAHPSEEQARAGFALAEESGVPVGDPRRSYVDPHHKPELICAVTPFSALCGFRPVARSVEVLAPVVQDIPALRALVDSLRADGDLRAFVAGLFSLADASQVADSFAAACGSASGDDYSLAVSLAAQYPGDIGVVLALLLNQLSLVPGEAVFLPAGVLHAYLHGVGVEIMACSDNVLRGGLTPKHIDVPELLRVVRFEASAAEPFPFSSPSPGVRTWSPPVPEFSLTQVVLSEAGGEAELSGSGPRIVFVLEGAVEVSDGGEVVSLGGGQAGYVSAGHPTVRLTGTGTVFQATTGL
ncbi:mannose-6-phosphate isomerase, class I [Cryptosporangium phraense]|uniref:mannose-6-phosphate isomerase n=1 Tax=Cryptosporangium phraense TaxID=2593070 RepID=A0A545AYU4_9ACTN|nr:mannose-6-phosphate isomerase, class I [Cryptosporangium phraense]TQS46464.1 mannose-6-phosphate isomerase, class I [Cryptosporangium phraense]